MKQKATEGALHVFKLSNKRDISKMTYTALSKVLTAMGYNEDEKKALKETVGTLRRMKTIQ